MTAFGGYNIEKPGIADKQLQYPAFKKAVENVLSHTEEPISWSEIKELAELRCYKPPAVWVEMLESEIGLIRNKKDGDTVWSIKQ